MKSRKGIPKINPLKLKTRKGDLSKQKNPSPLLKPTQATFELNYQIFLDQSIKSDQTKTQDLSPPKPHLSIVGQSPSRGAILEAHQRPIDTGRVVCSKRSSGQSAEDSCQRHHPPRKFLYLLCIST